MNGLRAAIAFLSVFPVGGKEVHDSRAAVAWYGPVGLAIGGLLALAGWGAFELWPPPTAAAIVIAAWVALTGALHLDGLADSADATFAPVPRERRLDILRDIHHGTFAMCAVGLVLFLKFASLATVAADAAAALVMPAAVVGRISALYGMRLFPAARVDGMGAAARAGASMRAVGLGTVLALAAALVALGWAGIAVVACGFAAALGSAAFCHRQLGGLTGDTYGAIIELAETGVLLGGSAMLHHGWAEPFPWGPWR